MKIRQLNRSGGTARALARVGATAVGLSVTTALVLSGCAQSDAGGSGTAAPSATGSSPAPESSDMASPGPSNGATEDGRLPEAADMEVAAGASGRGLPPGLEGSTDSTVGVAWTPAAGLLYVVTNGSSSCPRLAEPTASFGAGGRSANVAAADGVLSVQLMPPSDAICTMDFVPTTTVVEVPAEADTGDEIPVMVDGKGRVQLLPRTAEGEPGPITWLDS